eukprot:3953734-Prymnesium_polylepis.2
MGWCGAGCHHTGGCEVPMRSDTPKTSRSPTKREERHSAEAVIAERPTSCAAVSAAAPDAFATSSSLRRSTTHEKKFA